MIKKKAHLKDRLFVDPPYLGRKEHPKLAELRSVLLCALRIHDH